MKTCEYESAKPQPVAPTAWKGNAGTDLSRMLDARDMSVPAGIEMCGDEAKSSTVRYRKANIGDPIPCMDCGKVHDGECVNTSEAKATPAVEPWFVLDRFSGSLSEVAVALRQLQRRHDAMQAQIKELIRRGK